MRHAFSERWYACFEILHACKERYYVFDEDNRLVCSKRVYAFSDRWLTGGNTRLLDEEIKYAGSKRRHICSERW